MRWSITWLLIVHWTVVFISSCTFLSPDPAPPQKALLEHLPLDIPQRRTHPVTLLVSMPEADPLYDTTRITYRADAYQLGYFNDYEWAEKPSQMLQPLLVDTLNDTRFFRHVTTPPHFSGYDYELNSRLLVLTQDYTAARAVVIAAVRIEVVASDSGRVIAEKDIATEEPISGKGTHAGVVAANIAVARLLREIALFVLESIKP